MLVHLISSPLFLLCRYSFHAPRTNNSHGSASQRFSGTIDSFKLYGPTSTTSLEYDLKAQSTYEYVATASTEYAAVPAGEEVELAFDGEQTTGYKLSSDEMAPLSSSFHGNSLTLGVWLKVQVPGSQGNAASGWLDANGVDVVTAESTSHGVLI